MSAENIQNEPDVKKRKLENLQQTLLSSNETFCSSKSRCFVMCCKKTSLKTFDEKHLQTFYNFAKSGKTT